MSRDIVEAIRALRNTRTVRGIRVQWNRVPCAYSRDRRARWVYPITRTQYAYTVALTKGHAA